MSRRWRRRLVGVVIVGVLVALGFVVAPSPGVAGRLTGLDEFTAEYVINPDGSIQVTERLVARFAGVDNHGIIRKLVVEQPYRPEPRTNRVYEITDLRAEAPPGYSAQIATTRDGALLNVRIGDPDDGFGSYQRFTVVPYTLRYTLRGALNHFDDRDELFWNVTGSDWDSIGTVRITQRIVGGSITAVRCAEGPAGSQAPCSSATTEPDGSATFTNGLLVNGGVTTAIAFPVGLVTPTPTPVLRNTTWDWLDRWGFTWRNFALFLGLFALLAGWVALAIVRRGRDRQSKGGVVDQAFTTTPSPAGDERVPFGRRGEIPVEFVPPDKLRPAQMGVLVDEAAKPLGTSATLVDLAVRGYLKITEVPITGTSRPDYELTLLNPDSSALHPYEATLVSSIFSFGNPVNLTTLRTRFSGYLAAVRASTIDDALARGWFASDPTKSKNRYTIYAYVLTAVTIFGAPFLIGSGLPWTVFLAVPAAAITTFLLARFAPARSAVGTAAYRRVLGFRRFITESEQYRARFAERANLFTDYLPYAVMFGVTGKWAKTFQDLGLAAPNTDAWFVAAGGFSFDTFSSSIDSFSTSSSSTFSASASSGGDGGSGFDGGGGSDGGGGGGGGDGW